MDLYGQFEALSPIYRGGLTNHLPMLYGVYKLLNVSEPTIKEKLKQYHEEKGILDLTLPSTPVLEFEQDYIKLTSYFLSEMNRNGKDIVVKDYLNKRIKSLHSALFHATIRLYYAVSLNHDLMIAQALAYFELVNSPFGPSRVKYNQVVYREKLSELRKRVQSENIDFPNKSTSRKFEFLSNHRLFRSNVINLNYHDVSEEFVVQIILEEYVKTQDFYTLHLITGLQAINGLKEYFLDYQEVLRHYLDSAVLFLMFDLEKSQKEHIEEEQSVQTLINDIESYRDTHNVKLLFSLYELYKVYPLQLIKKAANLIIK